MLEIFGKITLMYITAELAIHSYEMNPTLQITTSKLNGNNFMEWSQSAQIFVKYKSKMKYILGTSPQSSGDGPKYENWKVESSKVMSYLLHSMQLEISKTYLLLTIAKEIWEGVTLSYSKRGITDRLYDLKK